MFSSNQITSSQGYLVLPLLLLLGSGSPSARSMADMARRAKRNTALDTMASVSRMDWGGSAGHLFKNDPGAPGSLKTKLCHSRSPIPSSAALGPGWVLVSKAVNDSAP